MASTPNSPATCNDNIIETNNDKNKKRNTMANTSFDE